MISLVIVSILITSVLSAVQSPNCTVEHNSATEWTVDCSYLNLDYLPTHFISAPVTKLIFNHNRLGNVTFKDWPNLKYIDVAHNNIKYFSYDTFKGLKNLKLLNISYNFLEQFDVECLRDVENLHTLDISGNYLLKQYGKLLRDSLSKLIDEGISRLFISSLNLSYILDSMFTRAFQLQELTIRSNNLKALPQLPQSLKYLDASNNNLTSLNLHTFRKAFQLETLIIEDNKQLTTIDDDALFFASKLKKLSLKGSSNLSNIPTSIFSQKDIEYLSLASCNFTVLPSDFKVYFKNLEYLDLRNNPWECGPSMKWLKQLKMYNEMHTDLRCISPRNVTFSEYFSPKLAHTILKNLLVTVLIIVFILFGLCVWFAFDMEKKRRLAHPYSSLPNRNSVSKPVYVSTVL